MQPMTGLRFTSFCLALKREDTNDCPPDDDTLKHTDLQASQKYDNTPNNSTLLNGIAKHDSIESIPNAEVNLK